jgi:putative PIN family toxin of toxin-antitoxin system
MRVVFDTNVLVRAAMSPHGLAGGLQSLLQRSGHEFVISTWLLQELEDVLRRPRLRQYHRFDDDKIRQIILDLDRVATRVVIGDPPSTPVVERDPKDDAVILTAIAGEADVICTRDKDLLDANVKAYCALRGIRVLSDIELLDELKHV